MEKSAYRTWFGWGWRGLLSGLGLAGDVEGYGAGLGWLEMWRATERAGVGWRCGGVGVGLGKEGDAVGARGLLGRLEQHELMVPGGAGTTSIVDRDLTDQ